MASFKVAPQVFERLPGLCIGVVVAKGIDNGRPDADIAALLEREIGAAAARLDGVNLKEYPPIARFRDAFQTLGVNPNKFMCSIEALFRRVAKAGVLPSINPVVDLGNAVSLKYSLPIGAHDIGKLHGDLEVRESRPGDRFVPFGGGEAETPDAGEVVYASGETVKIRRWIWRQSEDGKIDASTTDVVFPIDGFLDANVGDVEAARSELRGLVQASFGCEAREGLLTRDTPEFAL